MPLARRAKGGGRWAVPPVSAEPAGRLFVRTRLGARRLTPVLSGRPAPKEGKATAYDRSSVQSFQTRRWTTSYSGWWRLNEKATGVTLLAQPRALAPAQEYASVRGPSRGGPSNHGVRDQDPRYVGGWRRIGLVV
jgi:hypothetical protein